MRKKKIIHLLSVEPPKNIFNYDPEYFNKNISPIEYIRIDKDPNWISFFKADHHVVEARELIKLHPEYEVECWRPYGNGITKVYERNVDGIMHKVFPSRELHIPQIGHFTWSPEVLEELRKESSKNNILLNISVGHLWFHMWLLFKLKNKNFPVLCIHRSGGFKKFYYQRLSLFKKILKPFYLLENKVEFSSLKNADFYFSGSMVEKSFMKDVMKMKNVDFFMDGCNFEKFKPGGDKIILREKLNLPKDKVILMAVGNFRSSDYGYDKLVNCFKKVKEIDKDIQFVMIGGYKSEDVYQMGIDAGCIMVERISQDILLDYYRASDFFATPVFNPLVIQYGGFGSKMIEALACGLPVISNNIIHYPGTIQEREGIGIDMQTEDDLVKNIIYLKNNLQKYKNCRELARKYFDINNTINVLATKYDELLKNYYTD